MDDNTTHSINLCNNVQQDFDRDQLKHVKPGIGCVIIKFMHDSEETPACS